jgi:hypothetical protein
MIFLNCLWYPQLHLLQMFEYHNPICLHRFCVRLACALIFLSAYVSAVLCIYETQKKQNQTKKQNAQAGDITKEYTPLSPRTQNAQAGDITKEYTPLSPRRASPVFASPLPLPASASVFVDLSVSALVHANVKSS